MRNWPSREDKFCLLRRSSLTDLTAAGILHCRQLPLPPPTPPFPSACQRKSLHRCLSCRRGRCSTALPAGLTTARSVCCCCPPPPWCSQPRPLKTRNHEYLRCVSVSPREDRAGSASQPSMKFCMEHGTPKLRGSRDNISRNSRGFLFFPPWEYGGGERWECSP